MIYLALLGVLVLWLVLPIWVICLQVQVSRLKQQVSSNLAPEEAPAFIPQPPPKRDEKKKQKKWEVLIGQYLFPVLGGVSVVVALTLFSTIAFANGWVGETGQVLLGVIISLGFFVAGNYFYPKLPRFAFSLMATGFMGLLGMAYVARNVYVILGSGQTMAACCFVVAAGLLLAWCYQSALLGASVTVGGLITPWLTNSEQPELIGLLGYLLLLSLAAFVLSVRFQWRFILVLLLLGVTTMVAPIVGGNLLPESPGLLLAFIVALYGLLGSGGVLNIWQTKQDPPSLRLVGLDTLILVGAVLVANVSALVVWETQSWSYFGLVMLAQGAGFYALSQWAERWRLLVLPTVSLAVALLFVFLATLWEFGHIENLVSVILLAKAAVLGLVYGLSRQLIFSIFARLSAAVAVIIVLLEGASFWWETAIFAVGCGLFVFFTQQRSSLKQSYPGSWVWDVFGLGLASVLVINWSDFLFYEWLQGTWGEFFVWVPVVLWANALGSLGLSRYSQWSFWGAFAFWVLGGLSLGDHWSQTVISVVLLVVGVLGVLWQSVGRHVNKKSSANSSQMAAVVTTLIASSLLVVLMSWGDLKQPLSTVMTLGWGLLLLAAGAHWRWETFRLAGLGVLLLVVGKLYLYDVWLLASWVRMWAFVFLGASLLGVSFGYARWFKKTLKN